ncbi:MAG: hypothetical protein ABI690_23540 [Chloroflexota bacterium]
MIAHKEPRFLSENDPHSRSVKKDFEMHDEWNQEANRILDESKLRRKPDWLEAIGDEEDTEPIEANIRENWKLRGEDDYVSDPTGTADAPNWVDDDYDDESHT